MNEHRTAIARTSISAPARYLTREGLLQGRALDYGSGRGKDAETLKMEPYDPHHAPDRPKGKYKTIFCTYVLNVIEDEHDRQSVLDDIQSLLRKNGTAYITVRADRQSLNGTTRIGTWQGNIEFNLPLIHTTSTFRTYKMEKIQ